MSLAEIANTTNPPARARRQAPKRPDIRARRALYTATAAEIERLLAILDELDGDPDLEPTLGATEGQGGQRRWACSGRDDREEELEDLEDSDHSGAGDLAGLNETTIGEPLLGATEVLNQRHAWRIEERFNAIDDGEAELASIDHEERFARARPTPTAIVDCEGATTAKEDATGRVAAGGQRPLAGARNYCRAATIVSEKSGRAIARELLETGAARDDSVCNVMWPDGRPFRVDASGRPIW